MTTQTTPISHAIAGETGTLHAVEWPGTEPAVVLMHGFPDDHHIYDRLAPLLPGRVVAFDWLGYGASDRRNGRAFHHGDRQRELAAVLDELAIERAILVGHDASGPEAIDRAIAHPQRVERLVLIDTYYGDDDAFRAPELIGLLSDPGLTRLADALLDDPGQRQWLLQLAGRGFGMPAGAVDPEGLAARAIVPQFFGERPAIAEIRAWTADLPSATARQDRVIAAGRLRELQVPVSVICGAGDPYLGLEGSRYLAGLFPDARLEAIEDAGHWPQWDRPEAVARHLR